MDSYIKKGVFCLKKTYKNKKLADLKRDMQHIKLEVSISRKYKI